MPVHSCTCKSAYVAYLKLLHLQSLAWVVHFNGAGVANLLLIYYFCPARDKSVSSQTQQSLEVIQTSSQGHCRCWTLPSSCRVFYLPVESSVHSTVLSHRVICKGALIALKQGSSPGKNGTYWPQHLAAPRDSQGQLYFCRWLKSSVPFRRNRLGLYPYFWAPAKKPPFPIFPGISHVISIPALVVVCRRQKTSVCCEWFWLHPHCHKSGGTPSTVATITDPSTLYHIFLHTTPWEKICLLFLEDRM